ncbi:error-prone DNA polymerase [Gynuella sunshinyii]|uniref:Error-prone DNA polymerase n=1 Tax=Gynuella sunshinyii YC6258 TaxID=1445510 RepID=A0A0C5VUB8_9GAMM|nr:error-prone DNA polymerase [Gynuella sunshinyii]AJQ94004.1 DNA polymerase III, alpha subunit [Gynuella sunshinyii YC6258]
MDYAELHCLSNYSFLRSASHPEELVSRAYELGYRALALTDECSVAGVVKAWKTIKAGKYKDFQLIIGSEFTVQNQKIILLCPTHRAYSQLCHLITRTRRRAEKGSYHLYWRDLGKQLDECLCLWLPGQNDQDQATVEDLKAFFPERLWLLTENLLTNQSFEYADYCQQLADNHQLPCVCANHVLMHTPERKELHDALTAIYHNCSVMEALPHLLPNAENHLRSIRKIASIYPSTQINETINIARRCHFSLDSLCYRYPRDVVPGNYTAEQYLKILVEQGKKRRFPQGSDPKIDATISKELRLIHQKEYEHYFLTVYDIVRFARSQNILCQGRGSAANSVVCYCLGITEVDPRQATLLFERFISDNRDKHDPPDIDVDFEHERREEVIQYIYRRYGRKRAALAATVITYRRKSALRDIGKAMGININQLNQKIANYGWRYRKQNWIDEIISDGFGLSQAHIDLFKSLLKQILGFPRHLSQHVGGLVLTEGVVADLVPIENATMKDRTVIQWDKDDLEALGLMKIDILALGMLTAIRKTLDIINKVHNSSLSLQKIPREESDVYQMIQQADTIGIFQIESRAQMNMLPRLRPACYYDLVVQVAIVRPGPIHGDMVHPYLRRRTGLEPVEYPKQELIPILDRTLGVPIFQEQVIALAMVAANFTASEADELRRSMASWKKTGHISQLRDRLTTNMLANGYPMDFVERINRQIEGFGEYGFPESHAAGFALLAYISSWLKLRYPAEFCCALLNSLPMGFYSASQLIQDVRRHGVTVLPVDINDSQWDNSIEILSGRATLRLGFCRIKGLSEATMQNIVRLKPEQGYRSLKQLENIPGIKTTDLDALASANALSTLTGHRFQARWETSALKLQYQLLNDSFEDTQVTLPAPDDFQNLQEDYLSTGLTLNKHLLTLLREKNLIPKTPTASELLGIAKQAELAQQHQPFYNGKIRIPVLVIGLIVNRQMPKTNNGVTFVTLEDDTGNINVIVWLQLAQKYLKTLTTEQLVAVQGFLEKANDNDVVHVIAQQIIGYSELQGRLNIRSRDYH